MRSRISLPTRRLDGVARRVSANAAVAIRFVHIASMRLFGTVVFLITAACGCWKLATRPAYLICLLVAFGAAAATLPDAYVPIASGGVLGVLFCLLIRCSVGKSPLPAARNLLSVGEEAASNARSAVSATGQHLVMLVAAIFILSYGGVTRGEAPANNLESAAETRAARPRFPTRCLCRQMPTKSLGDKVYVPEPLYRELYRGAASLSEKPHGWIILGTIYRGMLSTGISGHRSVETLRARNTIFACSSVLRGCESRCVPKTPRCCPIDRCWTVAVIEPQWEPDGTALTFEVAEPGARLAFVAAADPLMAGLGDSAGFEPSWIPRVARVATGVGSCPRVPPRWTCRRRVARYPIGKGATAIVGRPRANRPFVGPLAGGRSLPTAPSTGGRRRSNSCG